MAHPTHNTRRYQLLRKHTYLLVFAVLLLVVASAMTSGGGGVFDSVEAQFADDSMSGLSIIPASCPSSSHYVGECSASCPSGYTLINGQCIPVSQCPIGFTQLGGECLFTGCLSGYAYQNSQCVVVSCPLGYTLGDDSCEFTGCPSGYTLINGQCVPTGGCPSNCLGQNLINSCTGQVIQVCSYLCSGGACVSPPPPEGILNAIPKRVRQGDTTNVTWSGIAVESCVVAGTNADGTGDNATGVWNTTAGNETSSPIEAQTIYILVCIGIDGTELTQSVTVDIAPTFEEL